MNFVPYSFAARSLALTIALCCGMAGCHNAPAVALGTVIGVGLGVPLLTRSHVEVEVSEFNESALTNPLEKDAFEDKRSHLLYLAEQCRLRSADRASPEALDAAKAQMKTAVGKIKNSPAIAFNHPSAPLVPATQQSELNRALKEFSDSDIDHMGGREVMLGANTMSTISKNLASYFEKSEGDASANAAELKNISRKFDQVSVSLNDGPISTEVTQIVLTKGAMLDVVTRKENQKCWRRISKAVSAAGTGDHNAVIYLENMATPVLKSSSFDPSAFIEAFSKIYQVAFGAVANAYGVPVDVNGKTSFGADPVSSKQRKALADEAAASRRAALLAALADLLKTYDADVKSADKPLDQAKIDALKGKLNAIALKLEN